MEARGCTINWRVTLTRILLDAHEEAERDAGNRCVDPCGVHCIPNSERERHIDERRGDALPLSQGKQRQEERRDRNPFNVETSRIEEGNHQDCAEIVNDGQGEQEGAHAGGESATEHRQHRQGEGDVGGHGDPPAVYGVSCTTTANRDIEERRNSHAAECRCNGEHRLARL